MENFPWTRLSHAPAPTGEKKVVEIELMKSASPSKVKEMLGDGSLGGSWQIDDDSMMKLWEIGVSETREAMDAPWPKL